MQQSRDSYEGMTPVIVGVTGHRYLDEYEVPKIRMTVASILKQFKNSVPDSPLILVSGLAEGADQLVAEEALNLGYKLYVVLPFEPSDYAKTFTDSESGTVALQGLHELIDRADWVETLQGGQDNQALAFRDLGLTLASRCHWMIALWDGRKGSVGGTGEVVHSTLCGELYDGCHPPRAVIEHKLYRSYVCWIRCSNAKQGIRPIPQHLAAKASMLKPCAYDDVERNVASHMTQSFEFEAELPRLLAPVLKDAQSTVCLNQTAMAFLNKHREQLIKEARSSGFDSDDFIACNSMGLRLEGVGNLKAARWGARYVLVDLAARHIHDQRIRFAKLFFLLVVLAVVLFEYTTGPPQNPNAYFLMAYAALAGISIVGFKLICNPSDEKYLLLRTLAEYARIRMYIVQISNQFVDLVDAALVQHDARNWVMSVVRSWEVLDELSLPDHEIKPDRQTIDHVCEYWLNGQIHYYNNRTSRDAKREKDTDTTSKVCLAGSLMITLWAIGLILQDTGSNLATYLLFVSVMLLLAAGLVSQWSHYQAYHEHRNRYQVAYQRFKRVKRVIDFALANNDMDRVKTELLNLGYLASDENSEWYMLHMDRPAEYDLS